MSKAFVIDDNHWVTINGKHVLINEEGEVQAGLGGKLNGMKISKATSSMKGGKFSKPKEEYKKARAEVKAIGEKHSKIVNKTFEKRQKDLDKVNAELDKVNKEHENDWLYAHSYGRLKNLDPEKYKNLMEKVKRKGRMAEKEGQTKRETLYNKRNEIDKRANERVDAHRKEYEANLGSALEKQMKAYRKEKATKEALSSARSKLKSAREANTYMKQRGTKVSKATPDMVSGRFYHPKNESEVLKDIAKSAEKKYLRSGDKRYERGAEFTRKEQKIAERKASAAKSTLEKARPKIAERRQAIRKYNEREDEKLAKAMGLGKYRKPYYETDSFKSGQKSGDSNV